MSNVKVINNAGKDVVVRVNNDNGNTRVIIDLASNMEELSRLGSGDVFKDADGTEYIVCGQDGDKTAVVRKEVLNKSMKFGSNNNWAESNWRKYLNDDYLQELNRLFGAENILSHTVDLTSLDGYDDYGQVEDKVSAMTIDEYRKYHKYIGNTGVWHYLSTPDSAPSGIGASDVQYVDGVGGVGWCDCDCSFGVRPFFILKSNIFVSPAEENN